MPGCANRLQKEGPLNEKPLAAVAYNLLSGRNRPDIDRLARQFNHGGSVMSGTPTQSLAIFLAALVLLDGGAARGQPPIVAPVEQPLPDVSRSTSPSEGAKPELERPTTSGEPTEVRIAIFVIDIDEISSAQQNFAASVFYQAQWKNPHMAHPGPAPLHRRTSEVWTPRLVIVNQQMAWSAFPEYVEILPDGEVVYRQKVWGRYSQPLNLHDFPMDRQTLSIQITAAGRVGEVETVPLEWEGGRGSGIAAQFSLPDWDVLSWSAKPKPYYPFEEDVGVPGFEMKIEVARRFPYWLAKVILPLCLIVIMSWAPIWIDPEQIGTNIGIATTAFLTLVAYLFAIGVLMPPVSYLTRMDGFILMSTLMVFAGLVQSVVNAGLVKKGRADLAQRVDRWSRVVYPVLLAVIIGVSFIL